MNGTLIKIIIVGVILGVACTVGLIRISKLDKAERKEKVMAWLLQAVITAEAHFGGGTGRMKLSSVYSAFVQTFPAFVEIIPYATFCAWVDESLAELKRLLETNKSLKELVGGD